MSHALGQERVTGPASPARAAGEAMEPLGRWSLRDQPARRPSGGEQQRAAFARAATLRPEALVLEKLTANLDPANVRVIEAEVRRLVAEGAAVVAATHDLAQARRLADSVALLVDGRLVEAAPSKQFFTAPASGEARAFLSGGGGRGPHGYTTHPVVA